MLQHEGNSWLVELRRDGVWNELQLAEDPAELNSMADARQLALRLGTPAAQLDLTDLLLSLPVSSADLERARAVVHDPRLRLSMIQRGRPVGATPAATTLLIGHAAVTALEARLGRPLQPQEVAFYEQAYSRLAKSAMVLADVFREYNGAPNSA